MTSDATIPSGVKDNELVVFEAYICKYLCANVKFNRIDFLNSLIENRFGITDAFSKKEKLKAINDLYHDYNKLILRALDKLESLELLKRTDSLDNGYEAEPSLTLKMLCPTIQRYLMPVVDDLMHSILGNEKEIKHHKYSHSIFEFLNMLEKKGELNRSDAPLKSDVINILARRGIVEISLTNKITLSHLGNILVQRRREIT